VLVIDGLHGLAARCLALHPVVRCVVRDLDEIIRHFEETDLACAHVARRNRVLGTSSVARANRENELRVDQMHKNIRDARERRRMQV
jgi:hypothetical protein